MNGDPLVSVIIPVYNMKSYLSESIDSVINQTYKKLEIIIIDDGSTDGSEKICDSYSNKDSRIIVVHQKNKGLSEARNRGLDIFSGEVVAFLDSDDVYHLEFIKTMIESMKSKSTDIVICKYIECSVRQTQKKSNEELRIKLPSIKQGIYGRETVLKGLINGQVNHSVWNKMYSRELWNGVRFPQGKVYEDLSVTYKIFEKCNKISVLDYPLYVYRKHSDTITGTCTVKSVKDWIWGYSSFIRFVEMNNKKIFTDENVNKCRQTFINWMIYYYVLLMQQKSDLSECKLLREKIISYGKKNKPDNLSTRICYWMMCYCPHVLQILLPLLNDIRKYIKSIQTNWRRNTFYSKTEDRDALWAKR